MKDQDHKMEKLNKLYSLLKEDTLTPKEVQQFLALLIQITKNTKDELSKDFQSISQENQRKIHEAIQIIGEKHYDILKEVDKKNVLNQQTIDTKVKEVEAIIVQAKNKIPKDGKPGKDADPEEVVSLVLEKLPPPKEIDGEEIVDKINDLSIIPENQIDFKHIKNAPEWKGGKTGGVVARNLYQMGDVNLTGVADGDALVYDSDTRTWIPGAGGGGSSLQQLTLTPAFDGVTTVFTLSATPTGETWVFLNGQKLENVTNYSISGATLTFVTAPDSDDSVEVWTEISVSDALTPTTGQYKMYVTVGLEDADYICSGVANDEVQINAAWAYAFTNGLTVFIKDGTYKINAPLEGKTSILMSQNAIIRANVAMTSVVNFGTSASNLNKTIEGGILDANNLATNGLWIRQAQKLKVRNIRVQDATMYGYHIGDNTLPVAVYSTYMSDFDYVDVIVNPVAVGSACLYLESSTTDNQFFNGTLVDADYGVFTESGTNVFSDIHVWTSPAFGWMTQGFRDTGGNNMYKACIADTARNHGFYLTSNKNTIVLCSCINATSYGEDGVANGITTTYAYPELTVVATKILGGDATHRFATDYNTTLNDTVSIIGPVSSNVVTSNFQNTLQQAFAPAIHVTNIGSLNVGDRLPSTFSGSEVLGVRDTLLASSGNVANVLSQLVAFPPIDSSANYYSFYTEAGDTNTLGINYTGAFYGMYGYIRHRDSGTFTNSYGIVAGSPTWGASGGTNINQYGFYIERQKWPLTTNAWALYQAYSGDKSYFAGTVGIGQTSPTALLHLAAGTATANTSPIKLTPSGAVLLTTPEAGAVEVDSSGFFYTTDNAGTPARHQITTNDQTQTLTNKTIAAASNTITLASLTATDTSLTFSGSYTGGTARTVGLNVANANTWTGTQTISTVPLIISGNQSTTAWTTNGTQLSVRAATLTDTSSSGTVTTNAVSSFGIPTLIASAVTTYSNSANVYIAGAPVSSTNVTQSNSFALLVDAGVASFKGGFTSNNGTTNSNFGVIGGITSASTGSATLLFGGAAAVNMRAAFNGVTATTAVVGNSVANVIFGAATITEAASGTHPIITNVAINIPTITNAGATTTDATTLYIQGAPTGITPTNPVTSLWVAAGNTRLGGLISGYNNIVTVSNGVPSELATIDSTGLTANVGATTLYAVPASGAGMYRVSAYLVTTTAASVSSTMPNAQVVYTDQDSNTAVTLDVSPILGAAGLGQSGTLAANIVGTVFSGTVVIYVKASTTIQYQTVNYASTIAGMTYALRIKLEAL